MSAPTNQELELVQKFRAQLIDLDLTEKQSSTIYLLTWIRARDHDLFKAGEMLRKNLDWRRINQMDNIMNWRPPKHFIDNYKYEIIGTDGVGAPILMIPLGTWDVKTVAENGEKDTYLKYCDQMYESVDEFHKKHKSKQIFDQEIVIFDFDHLSLGQITSKDAIEAMIEGTKHFEQNHPESMKACYIINAPRIFTILFGLIKPFVSTRTLSKVQIFGSNSPKWKTALLKAIPSNYISPKYGGVKQKEQSLSLIPTALPKVDSGKLITIQVEGNEKLELNFIIDKANKTINWIFKTDSYDIGFSVLFESKEIIGLERVDSHLREYTGSIVCRKPGTYLLVFDNTYSKFRSKKISYFATIA